ncbi:MAG TPA: hypothetical protein ENG75_00310 [Nitrospirae bacterium]|nr:hypothetical protein [Nitrospirota bacterium]
MRKSKDRRLKTRIIFFVLLLFTIHCSLFTASNAESPKRIISLAPSITEILFAAGLEDRIVGVTNFCDYPEQAKEKPKIGGIANPSLEAVVSLKPDIVVMTMDGNPREFQQRLDAMGIKTYVFRSHRISELPDGIRKIGIALDEKKMFEDLALRIEQSLDGFNTAKANTSGKMLFVIWPEPLIVAGPGTAINDAINLLGGINIAEDAKGRYPKYSIEEIIRRSPDVIFFGRGKVWTGSPESF